MCKENLRLAGQVMIYLMESDKHLEVENVIYGASTDGELGHKCFINGVLDVDYVYGCHSPTLNELIAIVEELTDEQIIQITSFIALMKLNKD